MGDAVSEGGGHSRRDTAAAGGPRLARGRGRAPLSSLCQPVTDFLQLQPGALLPMIQMCALMFLWGLANNLNDILIKQFKKAFELGNLQAGLVQTALYIGYFVGAPPSSLIANRTDYKTSIMYGLMLYAAGALLFYPSAALRTYPLFLGSLLVIGFGLAALETSVSPYLIRLGPAETAARRINFAAVWNPCGSIVGILGGKVLVFSGVEWTACSCTAVEHDARSCGLLVRLGHNASGPPCAGEAALEEAQAGCFVTPGGSKGPTRAQRACTAAAVDDYRAEAALATQLPYLVLAVAVTLVGLAIYATKFPAYGSATAASRGGDAGEQQPLPLRQAAARWLATVRALLRSSPRFRNGVLAQFAYVGAQIGVWSYLIQYMQYNVEDTSERDAADHVFYSLAMLTVGRAASTWMMRSIPAATLMCAFAAINVLLMAAAILGGGLLGTWAIILSSFFMSLMFPTIFTIAIAGLDKDQTQLGSSLIVMSIIGGAVRLLLDR
jgi:FHS family L-fucose permease-like MFS transporter